MTIIRHIYRCMETDSKQFIKYYVPLSNKKKHPKVKIYCIKQNSKSICPKVLVWKNRKGANEYK